MGNTGGKTRVFNSNFYANALLAEKVEISGGVLLKDVSETLYFSK